MNDRMANLDFDVPKLPKRKPRKPEPKEPDAMTFGGLTISKGDYIPGVATVSWTDTSASIYTLQSIADIQRALWNNRATFPSAYQSFTTGTLT